jgi:2,4-dienoyl-CoA reductase (NADPH2)
MEKGTFIRCAAAIKEVVDVPVICVGAITTLEQAEKILEEGSADLIAMCRAFIVDPQLINKTLQSQTDAIVECINCRDCIRTVMEDDGNGMACVQNPDLP